MKKKYFTEEERRRAHAEEMRRWRKKNPKEAKDAVLRWRAKNKDKVKEMARRQYLRGKEIINRLREGEECVDCGNKDTRVLEFDHVPERGKKVKNITNASLGVAARIRELEKCDIVCANCHRIRTYIRR